MEFSKHNWATISETICPEMLIFGKLVGLLGIVLSEYPDKSHNFRNFIFMTSSLQYSMRPMLGNPRQSWILDFRSWNPDSRYWIPDLFQWTLDSGLQIMDSGFQIFLSGPWIPDSNCYWDSGFLQLFSGFQGPGFRILQAKISVSGFNVQKLSGFPYMGRNNHFRELQILRRVRQRVRDFLTCA